MINIDLNSNKGITIISLIIAVIILLILAGTAIYNINTSNGSGRHNNIVADIKLLNDEILIYYNKYGETPVTSRHINIDGTEYYEIDLNKLENITLNYGSDFGQEVELTETSDVYVTNSDMNVYYLDE